MGTSMFYATAGTWSAPSRKEGKWRYLANPMNDRQDRRNQASVTRRMIEIVDKSMVNNTDRLKGAVLQTVLTEKHGIELCVNTRETNPRSPHENLRREQPTTH